jgi:hypothetical protein
MILFVIFPSGVMASKPSIRGAYKFQNIHLSGGGGGTLEAIFGRTMKTETENKFKMKEEREQRKS